MRGRDAKMAPWDDLQLEVPEHPHSPFMMIDFEVVVWCFEVSECSVRCS